MITVVWLVIVANIALRMVGLTRPLLGNFSQYQAGQAMMAKFFVENHFTTLLYPQLNMTINGQAPSLFLVYYPVSSLVSALFFYCFGGSLIVWGRLQAVLFFVASAVCLYRLTKQLWDERVAMAGLVAFCLSPLTIIYGQSFQNEMATVFFTLFFFYCLVEFLSRQKASYFFLSALSLSCVLITRPNCLYLFLPALYLGVVENESRKVRFRHILMIALLLLAGTTVASLWYVHLWRVTQISTNVYMTLFAQLASRATFSSPLIFQLHYYRDFFDTFAGIALTPIGFTLLIVGVLSAPRRFHAPGFFIVWCISFLISSLLIPRKLIDHNFYWLNFVVAASPFIGYGFCHLLPQRKKFVIPFLCLAFLISMRYAYNPAFKTTDEDRHIPEIGRQLRSLTEKSNSRIIMQASHTLLYYADRYGWSSFPINPGDAAPTYYKYTNLEKLPPEQRQKYLSALRDEIAALEYLREYEGATHFVASNLEEFHRNKRFSEYMYASYPLIYQQKGVCLVFSLNPHTGP